MNPLYDLPKDILVKLISTIEIETKEKIEKELREKYQKKIAKLKSYKKIAKSNYRDLWDICSWKYCDKYILGDTFPYCGFCDTSCCPRHHSFNPVDEENGVCQNCKSLGLHL